MHSQMSINISATFLDKMSGKACVKKSIDLFHNGNTVFLVF